MEDKVRLQASPDQQTERHGLKVPHGWPATCEPQSTEAGRIDAEGADRIPSQAEGPMVTPDALNFQGYSQRDFRELSTVLIFLQLQFSSCLGSFY